MTKSSASIEMIKVVASALGEMNERAVFVGGATVPFYLPQTYLAQARHTDDIDVVMEITGRKGGWINDKALREKGFLHDTSDGAPICRWVYRGLKVDVMSTDPSTVGFSNRWYKEGVEHAIEILATPVSVKIFSLPYFLASKIVAFKDRGKKDYMGSRDMEDIISVLEVSSNEILEQMIPKSSKELQRFLKTELLTLANTSEFIDALPGAVFSRHSTAEATERVIQRIKRLTE